MNAEKIKETLARIANDGCGVIITDAGNGSAGPGYIHPDTIRHMLASGDFDDAIAVEFDEALARESFAGQAVFFESTAWTQIEFGRRDGYVRIAWIWED